MAITYKVLGQSNPSANTNTTLYTVPSSTSAVCSTIVICNQAASAATFRIAVRPAGATLATQHYISYDSNLNANDSITMTIGITLATTDVITVRANTTTVSFNLFGSELT
jgi:glucose-6-phosphate dehydrogenase assembly protein OpcA